MVIIPNYNETSHNDCNQCDATEYWFMLYMSVSLILNIWLFKMIKSITLFVMQIRVIFALPSLVPPPMVPWAAAPVAYPSIHHCIVDTSDDEFHRFKESLPWCAPTFFMVHNKVRDTCDIVSRIWLKTVRRPSTGIELYENGSQCWRAWDKDAYCQPKASTLPFRPRW